MGKRSYRRSRIWERKALDRIGAGLLKKSREELTGELERKERYGCKFPPAAFLKRFLFTLEKILGGNKERDVYLDTNHLVASPPQVSFERVMGSDFNLFSCIRDLHDERVFDDAYRYLCFFPEMGERIFSYPNVFVTSGVCGELVGYRDNFERRICSFSYNLGKRLLEPFDKFCDVVSDSVQRSLREDDLLVGGIYSRISSRHGDPYSRKLSKTDKLLLAIPLASAFGDGREKLLLTYDWGIRSAAKTLYEKANKNSFSLSVGDFSGFERVRFDVGSLYYTRMDSFEFISFFARSDFFRGLVERQI